MFVPGATAEEPIELPSEEIDKIRKVLRLGTGDQIAVLPDDGTLIRCEIDGRRANPLEVVQVDTESAVHLTLAQALPKGDRLETVVRMGTEIGVARFVLFPAERSVVRWDEKKLADRLRRYEAIVRESAEQSYRARLPKIEYYASLDAVLKAYRDAQVLSEVATVTKTLSIFENPCLVVGPEGGWAPREIELIGDRAVTLGSRVLRTDTAGVVAAALVLLR